MNSDRKSRTAAAPSSGAAVRARAAAAAVSSVGAASASRGAGAAASDRSATVNRTAARAARPFDGDGRRGAGALTSGSSASAAAAANSGAAGASRPTVWMKETKTASGVVIHCKTDLASGSVWAKNRSCPSFADMVRQRTDAKSGVTSIVATASSTTEKVNTPTTNNINNNNSNNSGNSNTSAPVSTAQKENDNSTNSNNIENSAGTNNINSTNYNSAASERRGVAEETSAANTSAALSARSNTEERPIERRGGRLNGLGSAALSAGVPCSFHRAGHDDCENKEAAAMPPTHTGAAMRHRDAANHNNNNSMDVSAVEPLKSRHTPMSQQPPQSQPPPPQQQMQQSHARTSSLPTQQLVQQQQQQQQIQPHVQSLPQQQQQQHQPSPYLSAQSYTHAHVPTHSSFANMPPHNTIHNHITAATNNVAISATARPSPATTLSAPPLPRSQFAHDAPPAFASALCDPSSSSAAAGHATLTIGANTHHAHYMNMNNVNNTNANSNSHHTFPANASTDATVAGIVGNESGAATEPSMPHAAVELMAHTHHRTAVSNANAIVSPPAAASSSPALIATPPTAMPSSSTAASMVTASTLEQFMRKQQQQQRQTPHVERSQPQQQPPRSPAPTYYVLEINRIDPVKLPVNVVHTANMHSAMYTFSAQAGKPPTPAVAPMSSAASTGTNNSISSGIAVGAATMVQSLYRPDTSGLTGRSWPLNSNNSPAAAAVNERLPHTQNHTTTTTTAAQSQTQPLQFAQNWHSAQNSTMDYWNNIATERSSPAAPGQRFSHMQLQYNSYSSPAQQLQQQQQAQVPRGPNFFPQRLRGNDMADTTLRQTSAIPFNRATHGGGVW